MLPLSQISHPLLWTKAKRDWLFGSPRVPQAGAMKEAKCAKLTILRHLSHPQTLPGFWSLGPETQARVGSSQVAPDRYSWRRRAWLKPGTRPSWEIQRGNPPLKDNTSCPSPCQPEV